MKHLTLREVSELTGLNEQSIHLIIEREWIAPDQNEIFDDEDLARLKFIIELEHDLGANEAAIPIILHLVDQLHYFRNRLSQHRS
jgi:chaperone modulatory protein CbpM